MVPKYTVSSYMAAELSTEAFWSPLVVRASWSQASVVKTTSGETCTSPASSSRRLSLMIQNRELSLPSMR